MMKPGTLKNVNILFLVVIILVLIFGSMMQSASPLWGLVGTQIFLILLPTLIYLRVSKLPLRETIRWRWAGGRLAVISILLGISVIPFALWLGNLFSHLLGYTPGIQPGFFPSTSGQAVLMFAGIAILAPLCEEILFRGVIQPPYEQISPWKAVLLVGFFFLVFHLSLLRLFALIPVALLLGYVVWASNSLIPGVLVHAAYNAPIAILNIFSSLRPDIPWENYISFPIVIAGLIGLVVGLAMFQRYAAPSLPPHTHQLSFSPRDSWPVLIILVIFVFTASMEFVFGRYPDLLAARPLQLSVPALEQAQEWHYELRNPLDATAGALQCRMTPGEVIYSLECQKEVEGFTVELDQSLFHMESTTSRWNVHWSAVDFSLIQAEILVEVESGQIQSTLVTTEDQLHLLVVINHTDSHEIYLPQNALLVDELPWRLSALPFEVDYSSQAAVAWSARWDADLQWNMPGYEQTSIIVHGGEPLAVPAGNFISWKVVVGEDKTAWYDVEPPHTLLRYEDGSLSYLLK